MGRFGNKTKGQPMERSASNFEDFAEMEGIVEITETLDINYKKDEHGVATKEISSYYIVGEKENGQDGIILISKKLVEAKGGSLNFDDYENYPVYWVEKIGLYQIARPGASKRAKRKLSDRKAAKAADSTVNAAAE
jgi:hypothetical protein